MNPYEIPEQILRYTEAYTSHEEAVLEELTRTTHLKTVHPQMLSGKVQGSFLSMISRMIRPQNILEIGTFTGYSAYCLSRGLSKNGKLVTIEINDEMEDLIRDFFDRAGIAPSTELIIGDARKVIPTLNTPFDLVFIDGNKEHYPEYYKVCLKALKPGGYMIADNVLWGGKVATAPVKDVSSERLHAFNEMVQNDSAVENVLLTVRDGLMLIRKR
jgi:caffeoyl-CoA O-methyltransferase